MLIGKENPWASLIPHAMATQPQYQFMPQWETMTQLDTSIRLEHVPFETSQQQVLLALRLEEASVAP